MIYFAHVDGTAVVNVSVSDDPVDAAWLAWAQASFTAVVDVTGLDPRPGIGWTYDNGTFTPPPDPPAPEP